MLTENATNGQLAGSDALSSAFARWKKTVEAELKGAPFDKKLVTRTPEGVALQPLYTRSDLAALPDVKSLPGEAPFLRGNRSGGYAEKSWEVAQEITAGSPQEFNEALAADLMRGQDAVVITAPGEPGSVALADLAAVRTTLAGVDLSAVPVHIDAGADALPVAAAFLTFAQERKTSWANLGGSLTADPVGTWARQGQLAQPIQQKLDSLAGWTAWAANHAPNLRTIGVNTRVWGDAGANAVQELAFALATASEYLAALVARGVPAEIAARRVRLQFSIGPQFFTEIAKFRAWRPLWTRVLSAYGVDVKLAAAASVHAATGRWNKTLLDPHVNLLRVTTEALSAVMGGCDSVHIAPFDEVRGKTDDFSRRIARNVHTLLAEEFGFTQTADPAGGSWYVEKLTDELARKAWALFQSLQARGGMVAALREGLPQKLVAEAAADKADGVGKRRLGLIGTNLFPNLKEKPLAPADLAGTAQRRKTPPKKTTVLPAVKANAGWPERFEAALSAVRAGATLQQLGTLGTTAAAPEAAIPAVTPFRASAGFEQLRAASDAFAAKTGKRPQVFLAKIGPALQHKARADFSAGFFATGGFEILAKQSFESAKAAAEAAAASGAAIAVLCSTDETYPQLVPEFATTAKQARADLKLVLAGLPADAATVESFRQAGINEFIHVRANVHAVLAQFLKQIGALA